MSLTDRILEKDILPDFLLRFGIRQRLKDTLRQHRTDDAEQRQIRLMQHIEGLKQSPIAIATDEANEQHYEVPTRFYQLVLGKHLKYSSGYWPDNNTTFDESEAAMLALTCKRAELTDGQTILELGCGWGSLSLWMAEHYPASRIVSVSNSATQKLHIDAEAARRGPDQSDSAHGQYDFLPRRGRRGLRSRRQRRDVRAHEELSGAPAADLHLAEAGRKIVRPHLHPPRLRLPLRGGLRG